jgi:hypothetical protein
MADAVTANGPRCRRFIESFGTAESRTHRWNYSSDPSKQYAGPIDVDPMQPDRIRLLTVGQLIDRKGVLPALQQFIAWSVLNPQINVHWSLAGTGPQSDPITAMDTSKN